MARGYTKEFLVDAFMSRYFEILEAVKELELRKNAEALYDRVGKDRFREYTSLDAKAIQKYKLEYNI